MRRYFDLRSLGQGLYLLLFTSFTARHMLRALLPVLLGTLLLGSTSCKKEVSEDEGISLVNGLPYYHFTNQDQLWLRAKTGDSWLFENGRGIRCAYAIRVTQYPQHPYKIPDHSGILVTKYKVVSYYDETVLSVVGTDSSGTGGGGEFHFYRDATFRPYNQAGSGPSQLYVEGDWHKFIGNTPDQSDYASCDGMRFPTGQEVNGPFVQLQVRGKQYADVIRFGATPRPRTCPRPNAASLAELYYDRQAGLVRMVSLGGEVWDRVP